MTNENTQAEGLDNQLVSAEWLRAHLDDPGVRVIDIRGYVRTTNLGDGRQVASYEGAEAEYRDAHIPGAAYIDWTRDIVDPDAVVKAQVAPPARFAQAMGAAGVGDDTLVIAVDQTGGHLATRLWWALSYYGHDRVAVLDGGFNRWRSLGYPTRGGDETVTPATFTPRVRPSLRSNAEDVLGLVETDERQVVDARDAETFDGTLQRGRRGGHIPTARNLPAKDLQHEDGRWKDPEAIRAAATAAGVDLDRPVTAYCNGGVTATAVLFGLKRAGLADLSNYDGSWNEWGERNDLPVEGNRDLWRGHEGG